jgi:hypothetical protein
MVVGMEKREVVMSLFDEARFLGLRLSSLVREAEARLWERGSPN